MKAFGHLCIVVVSIAATALAAAAQPPRNVPYGGNHCTTVNGFGGVAWSSSDPGGIFGGALGWETNRWFGLEGTAAWLDREDGETGFAAALDAHFKVSASAVAVPFAKAGFGLYHATFEAPGDGMPQFYRRRMATHAMDHGQRQTFTDPALVLGGGLDLFLSRHVSIRPDYEAIVAFRDGSAHLLNAFTIRLAYHFEDHPITP